jgi:flagellar basal body-associated protein FliL
MAMQEKSKNSTLKKILVFVIVVIVALGMMGSLLPY